jgi:hypothetical protein
VHTGEPRQNRELFIELVSVGRLNRPEFHVGSFQVFGGLSIDQLFTVVKCLLVGRGKSFQISDGYIKQLR